jgi:EpsI family protein
MACVHRLDAASIPDPQEFCDRLEDLFSSKDGEVKSRELSGIRVALVAILLIATAVVLQARGRIEFQPKASDLQTLPMSLGEWRGTNLPIDPEVLETLGSGNYLSRLYTNEKTPPIDLFIAYYNSQRSGDTIHSPKNCLPGSGWTPLESQRILLPVAPNKSIQVNRYIVAKGPDHQLVMYWYQAHGRSTASEYMAKLYLVTDSIKMNRSDGGMVRVVTPIVSNETEEQSQARATEFAKALYATLDAYIPQ